MGVLSVGLQWLSLLELGLGVLCRADSSGNVTLCSLHGTSVESAKVAAAGSCTAAADLKSCAGQSGTPEHTIKAVLHLQWP